MKSKKNLESLKDGLFCLEISTTLVTGGGTIEDRTWEKTLGEDLLEFHDDSLKPEPIFKANK